MKSICTILPRISRGFSTQLRPYMHEPTSDLFKKYMVYKFFTPEGLIKNSERLLNTMYTFIGTLLCREITSRQAGDGNMGEGICRWPKRARGRNRNRSTEEIWYKPHH